MPSRCWPWCRRYPLAGLYTYLFDADTRAAVDRTVQAELPFLPPLAARQLQAAQQYQRTVFARFDEKVQAGVLATVAQVLAPFQHPDLVEAFCAPGGAQARLEDVLEGAVFLVELPLAVWGLGGKVASILLKLRFFNVMQRRTVEPTWNQERPVFFVCDAFQEIVSAYRDGLRISISGTRHGVPRPLASLLPRPSPASTRRWASGTSRMPSCRTFGTRSAFGPKMPTPLTGCTA